jgi:hypothetical protein
MPKVTITETLQDDDQLIVRGHIDGVTVTVPAPTDEDPSATEQVPALIEATGWVSAMTNHYDPDAYGNDGHLLEDAKPRQMTSAERKSYCEQLLLDAGGLAGATPLDLNAKKL